MSRTLVLLCLLFALLAGAGLRLVWVEDMEWKGDERWTYEQVCGGADANGTRWLGMMSSAGWRNPGASIWVFIALGWCADAATPTDLARAVQICNVLALVLLAGFALTLRQTEERERWLWATALAAVNPLAVLFQRKIWPPSVLPAAVVLMLMAWWHRERRLPAFAWGLIGALLGQVHGSGFFLAAAFFLWALLFDRRRVAWPSWLLGSFLGALPLIPWLLYLSSGADRFEPMQGKVNLWLLPFWRRWLAEPLGVGLYYALGPEDFPIFLRFPVILGCPTYLMAVMHVLVLVLGAWLLLRVLRGWRGPAWRERLAGTASPTAFTCQAALWGYGGLLTLSMLPIYRHYMIILFPLGFVWLAWLALDFQDARRLRQGRGLLLGLFCAQLALSAGFLGFIHERGGAPRGDYGVAYGAQQGSGRPAHTPAPTWPRSTAESVAREP